VSGTSGLASCDKAVIRAKRRVAAARGLMAAALAPALVMALPTAALPAMAAPLAARPQTLVADLNSIPARYLAWYQAAARTCPGLSWGVLAGIGTIESDNGRSNARGVHHGKNREGAEGPMQFEPATFAEYAIRADRSARLSPYNPKDAIFTAARMLCADGAAGGSAAGLRGAIFAYNHAHWYVRDVQALAAGYTAAEKARTSRSRHAARRRTSPGKRRDAHGWGD
jgi:hypothetical protein